MPLFLGYEYNIIPKNEFACAKLAYFVMFLMFAKTETIHEYEKINGTEYVFLDGEDAVGTPFPQRNCRAQDRSYFFSRSFSLKAVKSQVPFLSLVSVISR